MYTIKLRCEYDVQGMSTTCHLFAKIIATTKMDQVLLVTDVGLFGFIKSFNDGYSYTNKVTCKAPDQYSLEKGKLMSRYIAERRFWGKFQRLLKVAFDKFEAQCSTLDKIIDYKIEDNLRLHWQKELLDYNCLEV